MMLGLSSLFWNLLIILIFSTGLFFSGYALGYKFTQEKYEKQEQQARLIAQQQQEKIHNEYIQALNDARARQEVLLNDFSNLRAAHYSLRESVANSVPENAQGTALESILTRGELFLECTKEYADLATKADRHVSDIKTLIGAWQAVENKQ